jgi:hypothetical protein
MPLAFEHGEQKMIVGNVTPVLTIVLFLLTANSTWAAIELVTVTKATQKDCKLTFTVDIQPAPNGPADKRVTLVIPAKQVQALYMTPNTSYTFQIRDGSKFSLNVPLALAKQRDGSLQAQITVSEEMGKKAWVGLHVWLGPAGSGTAFSIDLGSYLSE